jgi:aminoglycoside/choline kinase family phosphotransferase
MADIGSRNLQDDYPRLSPARRLARYRQVLDQVARLHEPATRAARRARLTLAPPFTPKLYAWEQNLFCTEFLARHVQPDAATLAAIRRELRGLTPRLVALPPVLVHRDLQSSNILLHGGQTVLIDFQGMRFGPAAYDLASLLCDPYVCLPVPLIRALLAYYGERRGGPPPVEREFWVAAVERLVQALGAYGRLGANAGTASYLRHVPAALDRILLALPEVGGLPVLTRTLDAYRPRAAAAWGASARRRPPLS